MRAHLKPNQPFTRRRASSSVEVPKRNWVLHVLTWVALTMTAGVQPSGAQTLSTPLGSSLSVSLSTSAPGAATDQPSTTSYTTSYTTSKDPWESFNRSVFRLNDQIDQNVTKPLAQTYVDITPSIIRTGVRNFFGNISDAWSAANSALQYNPHEATEGFMRVLSHTTLGVYGLMDWATPMRLERHSEDFGQTLAVWGVGSGPYLVLPLLGPSTLRDSGALLAADVQATPVKRVRPSENMYELTVLNLTDKRAKYLGFDKDLDEAALDRYSFVRDAYLQKRRSDIYDGDPPSESEEDFSK